MNARHISAADFANNDDAGGGGSSLELENEQHNKN